MGDLIYGYCVTGTCTVGSGFTVLSAFDSNLLEEKTAGAPGPYAATGKADGGWTMQMVALKPASAGTGSAPTITSSTSANGTVESCIFVSDHGHQFADQLQRNGFAGGLIRKHR